MATLIRNSPSKIEERDEGMGSTIKKVAACAGVFGIVGAVVVIIVAAAAVALVILGIHALS